MVGKKTKLPMVAILMVLLHMAVSTETATTLGPVNATATPASEITRIRVDIVIAYECLSVWAIIVMTTMRVAETFNKYSVVKHVSWVGPLVGVLLAVFVLTFAFVPPNSGHVNQIGFIPILTQAAVIGALYAMAAVVAFVSRKHIGDSSWRGFPFGTFGFMFTAGAMPAISGIISSLRDVSPDNDLSGIIIGSVCIGCVIMDTVWLACLVILQWKKIRPSERLSETSAAMNVN